MADAGRLTDEAFWDDFWGDVEVPTSIDPAGIFERTFLPILDRYLTPRRGARVVEVGCAPGRWLVHCASAYEADVTGYESSPAGAEKSRKNFEAHGIRGRVIEQDFLTAPLPSGAYDVVLSLGFIEHFADPVPVVRRHADLLAPGGILVLEVPNLRGLQLPVLRATRSPLLANHNLATMRKKAVRDAGVAAGLDVIHLSYFGGFEPSFIDLAGRSVAWRAPYSAIGRLRRLTRLADRINGPLVSGYLCGVFEKQRPSALR